jgi:hypothetical protein
MVETPVKMTTGLTFYPYSTPGTQSDSWAHSLLGSQVAGQSSSVPGSQLSQISSSPSI